MTDISDVAFDPFEPGFTDWPYDQYARLREAGPVLPSPLGGYQLFPYDDCFRLLREPGTSVEDTNITEGDTLRNDLFDQIAERWGPTVRATARS